MGGESADGAAVGLGGEDPEVRAREEAVDVGVGEVLAVVFKDLGPDVEEGSSEVALRGLQPEDRDIERAHGRCLATNT